MLINDGKGLSVLKETLRVYLKIAIPVILNDGLCHSEQRSLSF